MATDKPTSYSLDDSPLDGVIGNSAAMREVYRLTRSSSRSSAPVLLQGETGTGKELIAAALHRLSDRSSGPFVRVNCGAFTEDSLDHELFGSHHGSALDTPPDRTGKLVAARGGSIFLNEINSTSPALQVKLLRVLQDREFERSHDTKAVEVDVRFIAASNLDLNREVAAGRFREDLYWRLNVLPILLPPLRRREADVELLARHFLKFYAVANRRTIEKIHPTAMSALINYQWPGNIRELQNYLERAVVRAESDQLMPESLPSTVIGDTKAAQAAVFRPTDDQSLIREFVYNRLSKSDERAEDLHKQIVEPVEKELLMQIMQSCNQTQTKAATRLGINRNTLYKKLVEYGLSKSNGKPDHGEA